MAQDICKELFEFETHCVNTDQMQVAELAHEANKEIQRLRDGIRALADQMDTEPPDNTLIHDGVGTVADVERRLRALLREDGQ